MADTTTINKLNSTAFSIINTDPDRASQLAESALKSSITESFPKGQSKAILNLGLVAYTRGEYIRAIKYYHEALTIRKKIGDSKGVASVLNNLGIVYHSKGDYSKALDFFIEALKISQRLNDKPVMSALLNNIGSIYERSDELDRALSYYRKSIELKKPLNDIAGLAGLYNNIGIIFDRQGLFKESLESHINALNLHRRLGDSNSVATSLNNIGEVYVSMLKPKIALQYYNQGLAIKQQQGDKLGTTIALINIGQLYRLTGAYKIAIDFYNKAYQLATEIGARDQISLSLEALANCYYKTGKYKQAFEYFSDYDKLRDSIFTAKNIEKLAELESRIKIEQKELQITLLEKDKAIQSLALKEKEARLHKQRVLNITLVISVVFVVAFLLVVYFGYRRQHKANTLLAEKNDEISRQRDDLEKKNRVIQNQKEEVELKNKEITDSLNYANKIQRALLPGVEQLNAYFKESFIFYEPRDIVSGDYYWFVEVPEGIIMVVGDCVGHGVPGAFMTVLGNSLLNEIVLEDGCHQPREIINRLHRKVAGTVAAQEGNEDSGGYMDIVICLIDKHNHKISFCGAKNPLYLFNDGELKTFKTDKIAIGHFSERNHEYELFETEYQNGDMLFLSSDGYQDQFGGDLGKKFMTRNLKRIFEECANFEADHQLRFISNTFYHWKGDFYQTDDVLIVGIRL